MTISDMMLQRALELLSSRESLEGMVRGKKIRIVRAVVYEGEGIAVLRQLSNSLPEGRGANRRWGGQDCCISIVQGPIEFMEEEAKPAGSNELDSDKTSKGGCGEGL